MISINEEQRMISHNTKKQCIQKLIARFCISVKLLPQTYEKSRKKKREKSVDSPMNVDRKFNRSEVT